MFQLNATTNPVRHFVRDIGLNTFLQLAFFAVSFIGSILISRALGPEDRGVYAWLLTVWGMMATFIFLGFDTILRKQGQATPHVQNAWLWTTTMAGYGALMVLGPLAYGVLLNTAIGQTHPSYVLFVLLALFISHPVACAMQLIAGQNRVLLYTLLNTGLVKMLAFVAVVALAFVGALTLKTALLATVLPTALLLAVAAGYFYRQGAFKPTFNLKLLTSNRTFLGASYVAFIATLLLLKIDQFVLGLYGLRAELGYYAVAVTLIDILLMGPMMASVFMLPRLQVMEPASRASFFKKVLLAAVGFVAVGAIAGAVLAPWAIPLAYGPAFTPAVPLFSVLLLAAAGQCCLMLSQNALAAYREDASLMFGPGLALLLNIGLNMWLIPLYGAMGAAWASVAAYAAGFMVVFIMLRQALRTPPR